MSDARAERGEQRRHVRRDMLCYLEVTDSDSGAPIGHLVDLTTSGMMLTSAEPIPDDGSVRAVSIALPAALGGGRVALDARQVWARPDVNPRLHAAGFEFVAEGFERSTVTILERLIEHWSFGGV